MSAVLSIRPETARFCSALQISRLRASNSPSARVHHKLGSWCELLRHSSTYGTSLKSAHQGEEESHKSVSNIRRLSREGDHLKWGLNGGTANVQRIILPWAVPILTWTHQRCSSRAGLVHPHVLSTANTNISQHPRKGKTTIFDAYII